MFDSKQIDGNHLEPIFFVTSGTMNGTASFNTHTSTTTIQVTAESGSRFVRQSRKRMDYQAGKGLSIVQTFIFGTGSAGVIKRVGYFDELNGIFLEQSGSDINMVLRTDTSGQPIETRVSQSVWSRHRFNSSEDVNGAGIATFNEQTTQIFSIDFQWLGSGRVRTFLDQGGNKIDAHFFDNANIETKPYMRSPNLPTRTEIENYTGTANNSQSMQVICAAVIAEADYQRTGFIRTVDRGTTTKTVAAKTIAPLLTIKLVSGSHSSHIIPVNIETFVTTADNYRWCLYLNPIYTGADTPSWNVPSGSASSVTYDFVRTGSIIGGILLASGYGGGAAGTSNEFISADIITNLALGFTVDGVSDELTLAVEPLSNASFLAALRWQET